MKVSEILSTAAELGKKHGVARFTYYAQGKAIFGVSNKRGSMCINGLIGHAILGHHVETSEEYYELVNSRQYKAVFDMVAPLAPEQIIDWGALANWNNYRASEDDVIELLEKSAQQAKELELESV